MNDTDRRAKELGLSTFDTALPIDWLIPFQAATGFDPRGRVVWCYDAPRTFGAPVGLDDEAVAELARYAALERGEAA